MCKNEPTQELSFDILSHDLPNQISLIKLCAEQLEHDPKKELKELKKLYEIILRSANRALELLEDVSILGKIRGGLEYKKIDLNALFRNVTEDLKPEAEEKNIRINYNVEGELKAEASPLIERVYYNLLSNAIKYSPEGGEINVHVHKDCDFYRLVVEDEGEGIEDKYKKSVFNRFSRHNKRCVKGSGLGLHIVKELTRLHGGDVWVENRVKEDYRKGSRFIAVFPKNRNTDAI